MAIDIGVGGGEEDAGMNVRLKAGVGEDSSLG